MDFFFQIQLWPKRYETMLELKYLSLFRCIILDVMCTDSMILSKCNFSDRIELVVIGFMTNTQSLIFHSLLNKKVVC